MAAALPIVAGIGTAFSVVGSLKQGAANAEAARYNAAIAERNAKLTLQQSAEDERVFRGQTRKFLGAQRAAFAASGIQASGTPEDVMADTAAMAELDALKIRHSGAMKAAGLDMEAGLYRNRAENATTAGLISAAGYLFSGAGNALELGTKYWGGGSSPGGLASPVSAQPLRREPASRKF